MTVGGSILRNADMAEPGSTTKTPGPEKQPMRAGTPASFLFRGAVALVLGVLAPGCGGGGGNGGTTNPPPAADGFTITASSTSSSVGRGGTGTITVTVTRTGSFTGPVSLQPTGMPTGVTALFSLPSVPAGQNINTLTFTASAAGTLCTATITVVGNGARVA